MVLLNSEKKSLGEPAPDFNLRGVDGKNYTLQSFTAVETLVVMFICNHCPYVKAIEDRILNLVRYFQNKSVQFIGICSNDSTNYPEDSPENLKKRWLEKKYNFPYLIDDSQEVARNYGAVCTPEIYVYDKDRKLAYHGRLDDNWQSTEKVTSQDLKAAIEALLSGNRPSDRQFPSMGCSIKWKS